MPKRKCAKRQTARSPRSAKFSGYYRTEGGKELGIGKENALRWLVRSTSDIEEIVDADILTKLSRVKVRKDPWPIVNGIEWPHYVLCYGK